MAEYEISAGKSLSDFSVPYLDLEGQQFNTVRVLGTATNAIVTDNGRLNVSSGGIAIGTTASRAEGSAYLRVYKNGRMENTTMGTGANMHVSSGGFAYNTLVSGTDAEMYVDPQGEAELTVVVSGGADESQWRYGHEHDSESVRHSSCQRGHCCGHDSECGRFSAC